MWYWLSEHHAVFRDIALIWITPILLAGIAIRLFRRALRGNEDCTALLAILTDDRVSETEKSRIAAYDS
jgi:hypothetical protein